MLERLVYDNIIDFLRDKMSKCQHGFLKNRSCLSQLLLSYAYVNEQLTKSHSVDVVYLDFRKAFDTVCHNELLYKLWRLGGTGPLWLWFKEYLSNSVHYVCLNNVNFSMLPVKSGVPQGSILGPLLFLVYINDLPDCIQYANCFLFADDTKLLKPIESEGDEILLQSDLDVLGNWCKTWNISSNASKV